MLRGKLIVQVNALTSELKRPFDGAAKHFRNIFRPQIRRLIGITKILFPGFRVDFDFSTFEFVIICNAGGEVLSKQRKFILIMAWNQKLLQTMRDPEAIVIKTDKLVAIKDKFPKARHHFLVLPHENIDSIYDLTKLDVELVKEMDLLSQNVIQLIGQKPENFLIGFHAEPSMAR